MQKRLDFKINVRHNTGLITDVVFSNPMAFKTRNVVAYLRVSAYFHRDADGVRAQNPCADAAG
jgi:hypothetical protein